MMPAFLLTLLPYLKKALPYLLGVALMLGAYFWASHRGEEKQKAKDAPVIANLQTNLATSQGNEKTLTAQIASQNASIEQLRADGDARAKAAIAERDKAVKANASLAAQSKALLASSQRTREPNEPCAISSELRSAKDL